MALSKMFTEDPQWNAGVDDPFEEDLHHKLFGKVEGDATTAVVDDKAKRKRERRRGADKDVSTSVEVKEREKRQCQSHGECDSIPKKRKSAKVKVATCTPKKQNGILPPDTSEECCNRIPKEKIDQEKSELTSEHIKCDGRSSKLFSKMSSRLEGSRFRMLNQQLYTSTGEESKLMFESEPDLFEVYHRGFNTQVAKWPANPLDRIISHVQSLPMDTIVCDFGCGEARLSQSVRHRVHSFDLVAINDHVTGCDMAHVPLKRHSVDLCIFCLSLMGTNVSDFIREARRVVKKGGEMRICEVSSRFSSYNDFIRDVEAFGFELLSMTELSKMFVELVFTAVKRDKDTANLPQISLKPCVYKRR